eukprot:6893427-Ditylum_brightwellii.AAC.1
MRVKSPDEDNWKKLIRVMKYLWVTHNMPLTLEVNSMGRMRWWVDASFSVHPNMRRHLDRAIMLGRGAVFSSSTKQKLNTKSSTEAKIVGVGDLMLQVFWT